MKFSNVSLKKHVLAYYVVSVTLGVIIIAFVPNSINRIIFTLFFLAFVVVARYDKKMKEHYRLYSKSPKWLKSDWTFWILIILLEFPTCF
jgi:putative Ca2+/H+ antiporter (TMEM165/GDT1 family)